MADIGPTAVDLLYDKIDEGKCVSNSFKLLYEAYFKEQIRNCMLKGAFKILKSGSISDVWEVYGDLSTVRELFKRYEGKRAFNLSPPAGQKYVYFEFDVSVEYFDVLSFYDNYEVFWGNCLQYKLSLNKDGVPVPVGNHEYHIFSKETKECCGKDK
jgi:hypothetical protein